MVNSGEFVHRQSAVKQETFGEKALGAHNQWVFFPIAW